MPCVRLRSLHLNPNRSFSLLLMILCASIFAGAQSTDATISGEVVDPAGRVITQANIEILNEETGVHYSGQTNGSGIYTVSILPPGQYRIQVSKASFKTLIKPGIILNVQSAIELNFTLPLGATSESVTVDSGTSSINTTDASVSTVIDQKFVENIPLNGRSFQDLISMTPGVVTATPQQTQYVGSNGDFSVNGQRTESNYYTVDGVSADTGAGSGGGYSQPANGGTMAASTALGTTQSLLSVDALQEFRVLSSTYSAEFGRNPGGQFSLSTRSGTNDLHGSAFDYLRNDVFDANDWFNNHYGEPVSALRQNDFGGTLGGPIVLPRLYNGRNRSFAFLSYEGLRLTQPQAAMIQYVPDLPLRASAPASLKPILNAFPLPSSSGVDYTSAGLAQFIAPFSLPSQIDSTSVRLDHTFSPKISAFFRMGMTPSSASSRVLSSYTVQQINSQSYTLGATIQPSKSSVNEFRLGYAQSDSSQNTVLDSFGGATVTNLAQDFGVGAYPAFPTLAISVSGVGNTYIDSGPGLNRERQWNLVDTNGLSLGKHQVKLGVDYRHLRSPMSPASPYLYAGFYSEASVLSNQPGYLQSLISASVAPVFNEFSAFVQDEWRLRTNLGLSLGLRWDANPPPTEAHGKDPYVVQGNVDDPSTLSLAPRGTGLWKTPWFNFAPRLGLAWTARSSPGWETVVRTGAGVFFDADNSIATGGYDAVGLASNQVWYGTESLPVNPAELDFSLAPTPPYTAYAFPAHLQLPYTLQWNTSLQQAIGKDQSMTLSYVASNGRRQVQQLELYVNPVNPNFNYIVLSTGSVTSNYQALQVKFERRAVRSLQTLASYTWSHSIDFGSNNSATPETRGNSDYDVRNNFQAGLSWDSPATFRHTAISNQLSDWGIDGRVNARSGFPVTLYGNYLTDPVTGSQYYGNVDLVPNQPIYLYGSQYPGGRAINPDAFLIPSGTSAGNAPRNFARGFGAYQVNLALRRQFNVADKLTIHFRAESFNLFNHPNFGYIDPYLYDATFGQATRMLNQSLGTVASQYQQGGPRSLQMAMRISF
jgi:hypothetical protein